MSIAALVLGIIAFILSFMPLIGLIAIFPAITSVILAIVDLVKKSKTKGLSIAGLILSGLSLIIMVASFIIVSISAFNLLEDNISRLPQNEIFSNIFNNSNSQNNDNSNTLDLNTDNNTIGNTINDNVSNTQSNNSSTNNSMNTNTNTNTTNNNASNITGNSGNFNNSSRYQTYSIGETATCDSLRITCTNVNTNFQNYNEYANIRPGYTVIKADFTFENTGNNNVYISFDDFECYADYEDYDYFYSVDNATFSASLPSGETYQASVYFLIPSNSNSIVLEYETNTWSEREFLFVVQ